MSCPRQPRFSLLQPGLLQRSPDSPPIPTGPGNEMQGIKLNFPIEKANLNKCIPPKDTQAAASALTSLGHVYTAIGDYPNALASHKQCVQLVKQMGDRLQEAREIGNVGAVYLAMGDFDSAVDCHTQHLRIARRLGNQVEEARAYSNLGSSHHYKRNFAQAIVYHEKVLRSVVFSLNL